MPPVAFLPRHAFVLGHVIQFGSCTVQVSPFPLRAPFLLDGPSSKMACGCSRAVISAIRVFSAGSPPKGNFPSNHSSPSCPYFPQSSSTCVYTIS